MSDVERYTTRLQAGLGLLPETAAMIDLWRPGMTVGDLYRSALEAGVLPNVAARRLRNIVVECFAPRYMHGEGPPVRHLQALKGRLPTNSLNQLLFLHTARANAILADFVRETYWTRYASGADSLRYADAVAFIQRAIDDGKTERRWAPSTVKRVSTYLLGACADYGLLGQASREGRTITPIRLFPAVGLYLAYDLHFAGHAEASLLEHRDWALFGLERDEVRDELRRLSRDGGLIVQSAGSEVRIAWKYRSMPEVIDVIAQG